MDALMNFVVIMVLVFVLSFSLAGFFWAIDKRKCEAALSRDVHCVWAAPTEQTGD